MQHDNRNSIMPMQVRNHLGSPTFPCHAHLSNQLLPILREVECRVEIGENTIVEHVRPWICVILWRSVHPLPLMKVCSNTPWTVSPSFIHCHCRCQGSHESLEPEHSGAYPVNKISDNELFTSINPHKRKCDLRDVRQTKRNFGNVLMRTTLGERYCRPACSTTLISLRLTALPRNTLQRTSVGCSDGEFQ